jgi:hypothetical protein
MMNRKIKEIDRCIDELKEKIADKTVKERKELKKLCQDREDTISNTLAKCTSNIHGKGCGKKTQIRKLTLIKTFTYSCIDEDWRESFSFFKCPKCGHRSGFYGQEDLMDLERHFKGIEEELDGVTKTKR